VTPPERVAIVGSAAAAGVLKRKLELFSHVHATIVEEHEALEYEDDRAAELLRSVDRLVYAPTSLDDEEVRRLLDLAHATRSRVAVVPPCREVLSPAVRISHLADLPFLEYGAPDVSRSTALLKRALDVLVSATALLVLLPLCLLIGFAIKLDSRGPMLFAQTRAGTGGRPFRMLKFRSMVADAEEQLHNLVALDRLPEPVFKLQGDPRVTRLGRILRRWSLDELPQLWNVLVGDMSLVGPRPEQLELVEHYEPEHCRRLEVKPGLTGPMQVYGRGELNFAERLAVERHYIENMSIFGDLRILALTLPAALSGRGAY
jgi:exopolysaccharide biosynthesis polyprenyl glycosylphosphotransferase